MAARAGAGGHGDRAAALARPDLPPVRLAGPGRRPDRRAGAGPGHRERPVHPRARRPGGRAAGVHPGEGVWAVADHPAAHRRRRPRLARAAAHQGPLPAGLPASGSVLPGPQRQAPGARPGVRPGRHHQPGQRPGQRAARQPAGLAGRRRAVRVPGRCPPAAPGGGAARQQDGDREPEPAPRRRHQLQRGPDIGPAGLDADQPGLPLLRAQRGEAVRQRQALDPTGRGQRGAEPQRLPAAGAGPGRRAGPLLPDLRRRRPGAPRPGPGQRPRARAGRDRPHPAQRHRGFAGSAVPGRRRWSARRGHRVHRGPGGGRAPARQHIRRGPGGPADRYHRQRADLGQR